MVRYVPATEGLPELTDRLTRAAANIRAEIAKVDGAMAHARNDRDEGEPSRAQRCRTWGEAQPRWATETNPHGPITPTGPAGVVAISASRDTEVLEYYRQLQWA